MNPPTGIEDSNKPPRPYTEYNIFFQLERELILQTELGVFPQLGVGEVFDGSNTDYFGPVLPPRFRNIVLASDWFVPGKKDRKKRSHRKTHGKISFVALSKQISASWKNVDDETRIFCARVSDIGMQKYKKQMAEFKSQAKISQKKSYPFGQYPQQQLGTIRAEAFSMPGISLMPKQVDRIGAIGPQAIIQLPSESTAIQTNIFANTPQSIHKANSAACFPMGNFENNASRSSDNASKLSMLLNSQIASGELELSQKKSVRNMSCRPPQHPSFTVANSDKNSTCPLLNFPVGIHTNNGSVAYTTRTEQEFSSLSFNLSTVDKGNPQPSLNSSSIDRQCQRPSLNLSNGDRVAPRPSLTLSRDGFAMGNSAFQKLLNMTGPHEGEGIYETPRRDSQNSCVDLSDEEIMNFWKT